MATAKAAKKTPAAPAAEKPKNALVKWDEVLAARAIMAQQSEAKVGGGKFISIKSGVMSFNGSPVPGNALDVVVVDSVLENQLYLGKYNPDVVQVPDCFAFGRNEKDMVPHKDSANPQADSCAECPHNEWGSADTGKGKKCGNVRRLALIPADALDKGEEGVKETELTFFKVPVTSSPNWTNYVNTLAAQNRPPLAFVTEIAVVPDAKTQLKVTFLAQEAIDDGELLGALIDKSDGAAKVIEFPYAPADDSQGGRGRQAAAPARSAPARGVTKPAKRAAKY